VRLSARLTNDEAVELECYAKDAALGTAVIAALGAASVAPEADRARLLDIAWGLLDVE
jgi:hypothetical protein